MKNKIIDKVVKLQPQCYRINCGSKQTSKSTTNDSIDNASIGYYYGDANDDKQENTLTATMSTELTHRFTQHIIND